MQKIKLDYLIGDVHMGGHDVHRVALNNKKMLEETGVFEILLVCDERSVGDVSFDEYFSGSRMESCQVFVFNCGNYRFNTREEQMRLERAVASGAGFVFLHGDHPCYWPAVGNVRWEGVEKMAGLLWREETSHGDFGEAHVTVELPAHPIMEGIHAFDTKDEIFCGCENVQDVPLEVLASAYSDPAVISRHGLPGTGRMEPIAVTGRFGKGRTVNHLLGHVWPYYTGHGLGENTMLSFAPREFRKMFVRSCEWAATGKVEGTRSFDGEVRLT